MKIELKRLNKPITNDFDRNEESDFQKYVQLVEITSADYDDSWTTVIEETSKYCGYDLVVSVYHNDELQHKTVVELKTRFTDYPTFILEDKKVDSINDGMLKEDAQSGKYINFVGDYAYIFDLAHLNHKTIEHKYLYCKKTTAHWDGSMSGKFVYYIPKFLMKKIKLA